jgi:hypothetical protein
MKRARRRPAPKPPAGFMWFYWELVPIAEVERRARANMGNHDRRPKWRRDLDNGDDITGPARRRNRDDFA